MPSLQKPPKIHQTIDLYLDNACRFDEIDAILVVLLHPRGDG